ncbi:hypothetical protein DYB25_001155 [Aphanomyces astaci]|uniref:RING-type domain-containing protein n=1 Tax=Aphanomyces astaci TaxID=112090 RepID=A0A397DR18_APHAT|nr:hypothetical protein AaE_001617 [Aphanomyces astaci]RHY09762.1 hypothetical protein DYB36_003339 [Aphanomyces astaci]RHY14153.1 hypothetical protein DYB25_001155 [Aphanomyces astaci]RHY40517.1 hypothetical protein DYB34_005480 [Aphanomyces astaci]RHY60996.1 hypothetical protein DYB38_002699 [Aphanomyces astaci]
MQVPASGPFGGLSVTLTKATVSPREPTLYTLSIANKVTHAQCAISKSDIDFAAFRQRICAALEHGHSCSAECPWMYFRVQEAKPRRWLFMRSKHRQVQANLATHQSMLTSLLDFMRTPRNQSCGRATTVVPSEVARFLFDGMDDRELGLYAASPMSKYRMSITPNLVKFAIADCSICKNCMDPEDPVSAALTTLPCGHVFHDVCILMALHRQLVCPRCDDEGKSSTDNSSSDDSDSVVDLL